MATHAWLGLILAVGAASPAWSAAAQNALAEDSAERRRDLAPTLFEEGTALGAGQRWAEAEAEFRRALENHDTPSIRYNLASALYEQGELPEADVLVRGVLADPAAPQGVRAAATELTSHLADRAGFARVEVRPTASVGSTSPAFRIVRIDGWVLPRLEDEVALAPGPHVAMLMQGEEAVARTAFEIEAHAHRTISLVVPDLAAEVDEVPPSSAPEGAASVTSEWWFWAAVGGGAAVVAAVVAASVVASNPGVQSPIAGDFSPGVIQW